MGSRRLATAVACVGFAFAGVGLGCLGTASAVPIVGGHVALGARPVAANRVGDVAEAWYATPPGSLCLPFVGCLPLPLPVPLPSTFPAGTLHVGETLGAESSRAYVVPALPVLAQLPASGLLVLPVDSSPLAGALDIGSARIKACLTTGRVPATASARGVTAGPPPTVNCKVVTPARYDQPYDEFRVDLAPFLAKWRHGAPMRGVALLPGTSGGSPLANWHVAFAGLGAPAPTIYSVLPKSGSGTVTPALSPTPSSSTPTVIPPPVNVPLPGATGIAAQVEPPAIAPAQSAVFLVRATEFRYPAIFIAPLVIFAGAIFFGRLFAGATVRPRTRPALKTDEKGS